VPFCGALAVGESSEGRHHLAHEAFELGPSTRARQALDAEPHLVHDDGGSDQVSRVLDERPLDGSMRLGLGDRGEDVRVEEEGHFIRSGRRAPATDRATTELPHC
jgi:hypothetical protein